MPLLIVFIRPIIVALLLGAAAVAAQAVDSDVVPQSAAATASVSELIGPSVTVEVLESRIKEVSAYDGLLAERLLWIRSAPPMGMAALTSLPYAVVWLLAPANWGEVGHVLLHEAKYSPSGLTTVVTCGWLCGCWRML